MTDLLQTLLPLAKRMRTNAYAVRVEGRDPPMGVVDRKMTEADLLRHLDGTGARIGQYLIKPGESTTQVAVLDLDSHKGEVSWEDMAALAAELAIGLQARGFTPHAWRSSGGNGIHLWMVWDKPQDAYSVRESLREILAKGGYSDGSGGVGNKKIEVFPRQSAVDAGRYGNQVWLPLAGNSKSVPLIDHPIHNGWIAGTRKAAENYKWRLSADVPKREAPIRVKQPVKSEDANVKVLEGMLTHIVSDGYNYDLWISVGMALHHAMAGSDAGFDLWRNWSLEGPSEDELAYKWNSFNSENKGSVTTIGTLKKLAAENGWSEPIDELFEDISQGVPAASVGVFYTFAGNKDAFAVTDQGLVPLPPVAPVIRDERDHLAIARKIIADQFTIASVATLIRSADSGDWFTWNGRSYERRIDELIENETRLYLGRARKVIEVRKPKAKKDKDKDKHKGDAEAAADEEAEKPQLVTVPFNPTLAQITSVVKALKTVAAPPYGTVPPSWIGSNQNADDYIALQDGLLHIPDRTMQAHTPRFFTMNALPYAWGDVRDEETGCAHWLKFLSEVFPDQESRDCMQEIMGYLVSSSTALQKMFLIKGLPRSGKGTITRVIGAMLGAHNTAGTTLSQLGEDFGLWPLLDKSAVFVTEARNTGAGRDGRMAVAVERLLMISGEDEVLVNAKGGRYIPATLKARVIMTANDVPALGDSTGAFASRFITLATQGSWLGNEDEALGAKLKGELPGILRWSLLGLDRLRARGRFIQPKAGIGVMDDLADAQNPVRRFLKECCIWGPQAGRVEKSTLYDAYRFWFNENGIGMRPLSTNWFGKGLRTAYRELSKHELDEFRANAYAKEEWRNLSLHAASSRDQASSGLQDVTSFI